MANKDVSTIDADRIIGEHRILYASVDLDAHYLLCAFKGDPLLMNLSLRPLIAIATGLLTVLGMSSQSSADATAQFLFPVANTRITSDFGTRVHPVTQQTDFHTGLDLAATLNQSVRTVNGGKVVQAGARGLLGNSVEVTDAKTRVSTIYGHLNSVAVSVGSTVKRGQVIGYAGSTGRSTGVHVHFTVKKDGVIADPMPFLNGTARNGTWIAADSDRAPLRPVNRIAAAKEAARVAKEKLALAKQQAEMARQELASARQAALLAEKESQEYTYLFNEGAISKNQAEAKQAVLVAAQTRLARAEKNVKKQA